MKVTIYGGYVVATYVPHVVVVNCALAGFFELVIRLLKFEFMLNMLYQISTNSDENCNGIRQIQTKFLMELGKIQFFFEIFSQLFARLTDGIGRPPHVCPSSVGEVVQRTCRFRRSCSDGTSCFVGTLSQPALFRRTFLARTSVEKY